MVAKSTKGVTVCMITGGETGTPLSLSAVTKAKPAVVTVPDTTGMIDGDLVYIGTTGLSEIDGRHWPIMVVDGTTISLVGSDTAASQGSFVDGADSLHYPSTAMTCMCWATMDFNPEEPETLSVGTYCDPTAQISSAATAAGTVDFTGYIDIASPDYVELLAAEADNTQRQFRVTMPDNGYLVYPATISQITQEVPLDGALGYSGVAALGSKPIHVFDTV